MGMCKYCQETIPGLTVVCIECQMTIDEEQHNLENGLCTKCKGSCIEMDGTPCTECDGKGIV